MSQPIIGTSLVTCNRAKRWSEGRPTWCASLAGVKERKIDEVKAAFDKKVGDLEAEKEDLERLLRETQAKCEELEKVAAGSEHLKSELSEARREATELREQALPAQEREKGLAKMLTDVVRDRRVEVLLLTPSLAGHACFS